VRCAAYRTALTREVADYLMAAKGRLLSDLLVLTVAKSTRDASPQVPENETDGSADFAARSDKVDSYWAANPPVPLAMD
jgi:hypothetical protein